MITNTLTLNFSYPSE